MAQIESGKGVKNLEGILDVEGIDVAFVGPNDLTQSLGIMGQKEHPEYLEAIDKIITTAKQKNKFSGIHLMSVPELSPYIEKGMTCNLWSNDVTMLMSSGREGVSQLKQ
jgi:2-dehydro-3-deoxyglucarate aldolase/4-hydroxy-2-oxoheptanedioate aldolase